MGEKTPDQIRNELEELRLRSERKQKEVEEIKIKIKKLLDVVRDEKKKPPR